MILSCQNISKAFVENQVLKNVSFHIEDHEKAAIVGINGAGKTTLLRIIVGEMTPDDGQVVLAKDKTLGYLAQNSTVDTSHTIYEELLSVKADLLRLEEKIRECENNMKHAEGDALEDLMKQYTSLTHAFETGGGYLYRSELVGVLKGLGFTEDEFSKPVATLSGGQKTRVALGRLLLQNPDLIILDEPTNHLDMNSIAWLETYLLNYKGAVLIVSHDRYFLDRIAGKVIEIDQSKATTFMGNYSDYAVKKEQLRVAAWNAYMNQQREIKHQEEVIEKLKSFNREKSIKRAESREKMLDKIEVIEKPSEVRTDMKLSLTPRILSGNDVLTVEHLSKSFDSHKLFTDVNFEIKRGEHVAIIGDNGSGKTTLLKILNGLVPADQGTFRLGSNVEIGYYDQEHHVLHGLGAGEDLRAVDDQTVEARRIDDQRDRRIGLLAGGGQRRAVQLRRIHIDRHRHAVIIGGAVGQKLRRTVRTSADKGDGGADDGQHGVGGKNAGQNASVCVHGIAPSCAGRAGGSKQISVKGMRGGWRKFLRKNSES